MSTRLGNKANEMERYRRAAVETLEQLDWCIRYLRGIGKKSEAQMMAQNTQYIRTHLLDRGAQPVPAADGST